MEINDRIAVLITKLNINANSFSESVGVKSAVIHNIIKGRRSKPSYELIQKILMQYEMINTDWLVNGRGRMWISSPETIEDGDLISLEARLDRLVDEVYQENPDNPKVLELAELTNVLLVENKGQKHKIKSIEERYNKLVDTLRSQLKLKTDK